MQTRLLLDRNEKKIIADTWQDVEPILENNKRLQSEPQSRKSSFRHIGTIPNVILLKWMHEEGVDLMRLRGDEWAKFIKRKLDDPDWRHLRTDK